MSIENGSAARKHAPRIEDIVSGEQQTERNFYVVDNGESVPEPEETRSEVGSLTVDNGFVPKTPKRRGPKRRQRKPKQKEYVPNLNEQAMDIAELQPDEPNGAPTGLEPFLIEARRHRLLSAAEEIELAKNIERGDLEAKERMVNANLRLVISQARRYQSYGLPMEELAQEGILGLIRAAEKFDWRRGYKFSTYGTLWIRQAIQRGIQNHGRTIRVPVHVGQREVKLKKMTSELTAKLGREPTDEEIIASGFNKEHLQEIRWAARVVTSLNKPIEAGDGDAEYGEFLPSDTLHPLDIIEKEVQEDLVETLFDALELDERETLAAEMYLGLTKLTKDRPFTVDEIVSRLITSGQTLSKKRVQEVVAKIQSFKTHPAAISLNEKLKAR